MKVYNNFGEFILEFEEKSIIMSTVNAKRFLQDLEMKITDYEAENGLIKLSEKQEAFIQSLYKNLYHNKKISNKLSVVGKKRSK